MIFNLLNYKQQMATMGCMVDHIHLDKKYTQHTLLKKQQYATLYQLFFLIVTVYIYVNNLV
jgi:hypothetical protein